MNCHYFPYRLVATVISLFATSNVPKKILKVDCIKICHIGRNSFEEGREEGNSVLTHSAGQYPLDLGPVMWISVVAE